MRRSLPGDGEWGSCVQRFRGRGCSRVAGVLQPARRGAASGHPGPRPPRVPWPRGTLMSVSCCPSDVGCVPSPGNGQDVPSSRPTAGRLPGEPAALGPSMSSPIAGSGAVSSPHPAGQRGQSRLSPTLTGVGRGSCHRNLPDLAQCKDAQKGLEGPRRFRKPPRRPGPQARIAALGGERSQTLRPRCHCGATDQRLWGPGPAPAMLSDTQQGDPGSRAQGRGLIPSDRFIPTLCPCLTGDRGGGQWGERDSPLQAGAGRPSGQGSRAARRHTAAGRRASRLLLEPGCPQPGRPAREASRDGAHAVPRRDRSRCRRGRAGGRGPGGQRAGSGRRRPARPRPGLAHAARPTPHGKTPCRKKNHKGVRVPPGKPPARQDPGDSAGPGAPSSTALGPQTPTPVTRGPLGTVSSPKSGLGGRNVAGSQSPPEAPAPAGNPVLVSMPLSWCGSSSGRERELREPPRRRPREGPAGGLGGRRVCRGRTAATGRGEGEAWGGRWPRGRRGARGPGRQLSTAWHGWALHHPGPCLPRRARAHLEQGV